MAQAGVVGAAEVFTPTSSPASTGLSGTPAMWAFVWVGFAALVLMFLHLAIAGRAGR
jgi:hypothetical protein